MREYSILSRFPEEEPYGLVQFSVISRTHLFFFGEVVLSIYRGYSHRILIPTVRMLRMFQISIIES